MHWQQTEIVFAKKPRGVHLVTREILANVSLTGLEAGFLQLFLQHTSASLTLNENVSGAVRRDFERYLRHVVPDETDYFEHRLEGPDDMPAHIKSSFLGASLLLPIRNGRLALGTWQGIYLCEHREAGGARTVLATVFGQRSAC
ncbi:MAG: YjbQ family protein [Trueperaceae bacterium]|nr:MAG: YjbQ family protein [Trueperaceae bacterium]